MKLKCVRNVRDNFLMNKHSTPALVSWIRGSVQRIPTIPTQLKVRQTHRQEQQSVFSGWKFHPLRRANVLSGTLRTGGKL